MSTKRPAIAFLAHSLIGDYQMKQWQALHRHALERDVTVHMISPFIFYAQKRNRAEAFRTFELATPENVDGVIVSGASFEHFFTAEQIRSFYQKREGTPICNITIGYPGVPSVIVDNRSGFYRLVSHMIEVHGYRRLAFVQGTRGNADARIRWEAYRDCLADHGIAWNDNLVVQGDFGFVSGQNAVEDLLGANAPRPEAILCANDEMALGALAALTARGLRVPEDIALAGFDDMEAGAFASSPLTTVSQGIGSQVEKALDLILDELEGKAPSKGVELQAELVIRRSCGCHPAVAGLPGEAAPHSQVLFHAYEAIAEKGHSLGQIANFTKSTLEALSLEALGEQLNDLCFGLNLPTLVVVLYENGAPQSPPADRVPAEARVLFSLVDGQIQTGLPAFSPQDWFPGADGFLSRRRTTIISEFLFQGEHYGYFLAESPTPDPVLFHMIRSEVSNCLRNIHMKHRMDEAVQKLKELDNLKNQFIANVTHDFRSPLTITLGTSELGLLDAPEGSEDQQRYQVIRDASLKLKSSVDRFLDLTKMDNRGLTIRAARLPLLPFLTEIAEFYSSSVLGSGIQVKTNLPPQDFPDFWSDKDKLEEILTNLVSNAVKFVPPTTGLITIAAQETPTTVQISVADNGDGIPPDKLEAVFERFTQLATERNTRTKGTGIGLAFSRQLAGYLHGSLTAQSEGLGLGATFVLTLPKGNEAFSSEELGQDPYSGVPAPSPREEHRETFLRNYWEGQPQSAMVEDDAADLADPEWDAEPDPKRGLILIVEDNHSILDLERNCLAAAGYTRFILADDGKKGLEAAYLHHPDLIVCDVNMPGMRGDELYERLLQDPAFHHTPFLFVSAVSERNFILDLRRKGAGAFLTKPIDTQEFVLTVELHLRGVFERKKALRSSRTDALTGLFSRRPLFEEIQKQFANRRYRDLSFLFLDIDHFKNINDTYGHAAGDQVLSAVGACLREDLRPYDIAGRYGGEEFLLLLPDTGLEAALRLAEKLRSKVALLPFEFDGNPVAVRASFGVSSLKPLADEWAKDSGAMALPALFEPVPGTVLDWPARSREIQNVINALIERADQALYRAKNRGRNRVEHLHQFQRV